MAELNRRLAIDPHYQLPDGFSKVTEKEITNVYTIPSYFPIAESTRVSVEVLDGLLNSLFGIHILEPMSQVKETVHARALVLKQMARDKVMGEIATQTNKNAISGLVIKPRTNRMDKGGSSSVDTGLASAKKAGIPRDSSRAEMAPVKPSPLPQIIAPKLPLGVNLKLEVTKQPAGQRATALEAAYAIEEILSAVEQGLPSIPRLGAPNQKRPQNKVVEERMKKVEDEEKQRQTERQKLELRKRLLKEQLEKMKEEKKEKDKLDEVKKKEKEAKAEERKKKAQEKLNADMDKLKIEFTEKREKKEIEEAEKKAKEQKPSVDPVAKKLEIKEKMKVKKLEIIETLKKQAEDKKEAKTLEEQRKVKKEEVEKVKSKQIKQMYEETKQKAKEMKEHFKEEYDRFYQQDGVKRVFELYEKSLQTMFELYSKFDSKEGGTMSYKAYMLLGQKTGLIAATTGILSGQDYVYVFKSLMKNKKKADPKFDFLADVQGTKLSFVEFKEAMLRIACLGKYKLGGGGYSNPDDAREHEQRQKLKLKEALQTAAKGGVLKKPKEEFDEGYVNEDLLNVFEKEFDVNDMNELTIENLFKKLALTPSKQEKAPGAPPKRKGGRQQENSQSPFKAQQRMGGESGDDM